MSNFAFSEGNLLFTNKNKYASDKCNKTTIKKWTCITDKDVVCAHVNYHHLLHREPQVCGWWRHITWQTEMRCLRKTSFVCTSSVTTSRSAITFLVEDTESVLHACGPTFKMKQTVGIRFTKNFWVFLKSQVQFYIILIH